MPSARTHPSFNNPTANPCCFAKTIVSFCTRLVTPSISLRFVTVFKLAPSIELNGVETA